MDYTPVESFLNSYKELLDKYQEEIDENNKNDDNLFSSISNSFKNENYTSDILRFILDPKSMDNNSVYLQEFLKFIGIKKEQINTFLSDLNNIEVLREKHRVDILIRNIKEKKAIILESKLNDANDQPMQLVRYYKILTKEEYDILKIVYLTINPKNPRLDYYEGFDITKEEFEILKLNVYSLLFKTFISSGDSTEDFHNFKEYLELPEVSKSDIVKQFSRLLNKIGDKISMNEMEIIENIFSKINTIQNANDLSVLWNDRARVLCQIFIKSFQKKYLDTKNWKKDADGCLYSKEEIAPGIKLYICPLYNKKSFWVQIGFHAVKRSAFKEKKQTISKILKNIFTEMKLEIDGFYNTIRPDNVDYCLEYTYDENEPLINYYKNVQKMIEILKNNVENNI